jgi:hypothetical protein
VSAAEAGFRRVIRWTRRLRELGLTDSDEAVDLLHRLKEKHPRIYAANLRELRRTR